MKVLQGLLHRYCKYRSIEFQISQMNKRFDFNGFWANLILISIPIIRLKLIEIFWNKSLRSLHITGALGGTPTKIFTPENASEASKWSKWNLQTSFRAFYAFNLRSECGGGGLRPPPTLLIGLKKCWANPLLDIIRWGGRLPFAKKELSSI